MDSGPGSESNEDQKKSTSPLPKMVCYCSGSSLYCSHFLRAENYLFIFTLTALKLNML